MAVSAYTLNIANFAYADQLTAAGVQGLVNRETPELFLDWGIYDDVAARTTNEVFISENIWQDKFRAFVGNQDLANQSFYEEQFNLSFESLDSLEACLQHYKNTFQGVVIWDRNQLDTVNVAIMLAGQENLLILSPEQFEMYKNLNLSVRYDLRGRWQDRLALYRWAEKTLMKHCHSSLIACVEPGWRRPEFVDYLVKNRVFTYSLGTGAARPLARWGQSLLLLLVAGPFKLRNWLFNLRLDGPIRGLGLWMLGLGNKEARLATRLQRKLSKSSFPTIFGWHTTRDDEFSFMLHLSGNGLRLVPSHLASNFSFHSSVPCAPVFSQTHCEETAVHLEQDKTYLTFTLSDGDQLLLMNNRQLGNWDRPERGWIPFNWEVQPYLLEMAPALFSRYTRTLTQEDYLIAGPSGAGYVIPPLMKDFRRYLQETARICCQADIRVMTSYIGDPPLRTIKEHVRGTPDFIGYLGGYVHFGRHPQYLMDDKPFVAYQWPPLEKVDAEADKVLAGVGDLIRSGSDSPRFIAVHLFAYRTTLTDVRNFVAALDPDRVKVVRADEFLLAARAYYAQKTEKERTPLDHAE